ncbi:single-stranded DNA-binding protein [Pseudoalteromonas sp. SK20]|uniref:single-stranded DNA-binding protein n=1 Tax=Pseudoalteromonas sp. SK20 TaxID=1938367 RepID=UPI000975622E|nr:single-stranded DNA-binding protein [Pseudoalteromonas sp. SK20]
MFNQSIVVGNLFQDPVLRYTKSGAPIVNISVGTNTIYKVDGEQHKKTESHDVFFTGAVAENIEKYLKKGSLVFLTGEQSTSVQEHSVKGKIYHKKIKGHVIKFLDGKNKDHAYTDNSNQQDNQPNYQSAPQQQGNSYQSAPQQPHNNYQSQQSGFAPNDNFNDQ